jgi:molecular chaperone DnaK
MSRTTIDFGIDLGTTNSAIAELKDVSTQIIKNEKDQDVTPSAVFINKSGMVYVGDRAKNGMARYPKDTYVEFKKRMGTPFEYSFESSGLKKKPEDLSAEVLKALRAEVTRTTGEEIHQAVITVPAAFELHQCDATRKAAELAGLSNSPLLQEPVAAALAYGFQAESDREYWLVYDFGGGTFDSAIIKAEDGLINVVHHGGDNSLGGSDIDWAILEKVIIPRLSSNFDLTDFKRGNDKWLKEILLLKRSIEIAKIELSSKSSTTLSECAFEDDSGTLIDFEDLQMTLTQGDVLSAAEPIIQRSIDISKKVLKEKNLTTSAIHKIILVGGPTKAPYFRECLANGFVVAPDTSMDPLTAVAKGAAVFAGTQRISAKSSKVVQEGEYIIELEYSPVGAETDPIVGGKVSAPTGVVLDDHSIEVVNEKTKWRSGRIPLRPNGTFVLNLYAEKGERNNYLIEIFDSTGSIKKITPDKLSYTVGSVIEEQPLIHSIGIAVSGNKNRIIIEKGTGLPAKAKYPGKLVTSKAIIAGEKGSSGIVIPIIEGDNEKADRNKKIDVINISSDQVKRDLPAGSEIEISMKIPITRGIHLTAYIPILDEEYEFSWEPEKKLIDSRELSSDLKVEINRMDSLSQQAEESNDKKTLESLEKIKKSQLLKDLKTAVDASKGDPDAATKADGLLLEFKLALDLIEDQLHWPSMVAQLKEWIGDLEKLAGDHGNPSQKEKTKELEEEADSVINNRETDRIAKTQSRVESLYFQVLYSIPSFWVNQFRQLDSKRGQMTDQNKAEKLFDMGQRYLTENNVDGLTRIVRDLWRLLPENVVAETQRGWGANLIG